MATDYWTGLYIGAHGGDAWGNARLFLGPLEITGPGLDLKGAYGGGQIGYNYQIRPWVFGLELDSSFGKVGRTDTFPVAGIGLVTLTSSIDYLGSFRARFGYAWDRVLLYGTGGLAWASNKETANTNLPPFTVGLSSGNTHFGWTGGGGIEFAFPQNLSARVEYLYASYNQQTYFANIAPGFPGIGADAHIQSVRVGLNYFLTKGETIARRY
jgi:outer membrane immunogenic protein